ncbi:class I SAM-dependent methyltransferase [Pseudonocardia sp. TRM90224]|uniref:class I SAM-dependent methyltransferase n=1 Tax=Pseudonocardia sp. TRM90224 TaxID=2812678 RepID=UPI001E399FCE|nr:class I SAM-dependent methyltransferase [Pseudonocardia sp. TRM90224]
MRAVDVIAGLEALTGPQGRALQERLRGLDVGGAEGLRLGTQLRREFPTQLVIDAMAQQELRRRASAKFRLAADMFFTRDGWEQASAEVVSTHRRTRFRGCARVADLCCGIGGDLVAIAAECAVRAVDRDPVHVWMARQNARVHGVAERVDTGEADVRDVDLADVDGVFVDPARRSGAGRKRLGESEPPLEWCLELPRRVGKVGIKAAPGIPHDVVPEGWELEFVAVDRELKEAAVWSPALATARTRATVLPAGDTLVAEPGTPVAVGEPAEFLLDPNPAVTRAGLVEDLARGLDVHKIDEQIAFLTADRAVHTPFARTLRVIDSAPWNQKQLPARLRALDVGAVDIRRRGLAGDVDALHRKLRLSGSRRATLVMTRVRDRPWALVCLDVPVPGPGDGSLVP